MTNVRSEILKELVAEYRMCDNIETKKRIFERILARVDRLLISKVNRIKRGNHQLKDIDSQDLYHTAIVGLHRGIMSAKETDSGDTIQARILSYVKEEIRVTLLGKKRIMNVMDPLILSQVGPYEDPDDTVEKLELMEMVMKMVDSGEIPRNEMNMLVDNAVNGKSFTEIGLKLGLHYTTVSKRVKRVISIIREKLNLNED